MTARQPTELVLALYPCSRGLAFVLFEGPLSPIDWSLKNARGRDRNGSIMEATKVLIDRCQPDVVVLPRHRSKPNRRMRPMHRLEQRIATYAASQAIECHHYSREEIRMCFRDSGAITRYEIAQTIAAHVPALSHRLPPMKKLWQSEDGRMDLFDAASLVMTHFCHTNGFPRAELSPDAL
jgi:hypothetical protein